MDIVRPEANAPAPVSPRRRRFLARGAVASLAAASGAAAAADTLSLNAPPQVPQWMREPGAGFLTPPYGLPSPFEKHVLRKLPDQPSAFPTATRTPLQSLFGTNTPNSLFFERHHAIRLHPPRHAAGQPAIADTERGVRGDGVHLAPERHREARCGARCVIAGGNQDAEPGRVSAGAEPNASAV